MKIEKKLRVSKMLEEAKTSSEKSQRSCNSPLKKCSTDMFVLLTYSCGILIIYIYTMYPSVPGGDSGELIAAAHELGVAHPPGYPLFTILSWIAIKIVPYGNVAVRVNLLNAILSATASCVFSLTIYRYTHSTVFAILGTSLWSLNKITWTWSATAEVFGLNNLFVALLLYLMVTFEQVEEDYKTKVAYIGSFVCGLSLCNQHTIIVFVAIISVWVLWELHRAKRLRLLLLLRIGVFFLFGLVPYSYLPLSSLYSSGRWTWGDQSTVEGFLTHVLRKEYGTFNLANGQDADSNSFLLGLMSYVHHIRNEFTITGNIVGLIGIANAVLMCLPSLWCSLVMCIVYLVLFIWRANLDLSNPLFLGVVERFWMQANCVAILLAVVGCERVYKYIKHKFVNKDLTWLEMTVVAVLSASIITKNSDCNQRNNTVVAEFGKRLLLNMPENALVLTVGDLPSNVLRYFYLCKNLRPDIQIFDQEVMTYKWSLPMLRDSYPRINFPGVQLAAQTALLTNGQWLFDFKTFLDANYGKSAIIGCIGIQTHDESWKRRYHLFPYGPCYLVVRNGDNVDLAWVIKSTTNISADWNYPYLGFDSRSWERVATDEMWNAKINIAIHLYKEAVKVQRTNIDLYTTFMIKSFELYKKEIDKLNTADIPDNWHRNYALACERMLSISHNYDNGQMLLDTIHHFQMYIQKNPTDQDIPVIKQSVIYLQEYIGKL